MGLTELLVKLIDAIAPWLLDPIDTVFNSINEVAARAFGEYASHANPPQTDIGQAIGFVVMLVAIVGGVFGLVRVFRFIASKTGTNDRYVGPVAVVTFVVFSFLSAVANVGLSDPTRTIEHLWFFQRADWVSSRIDTFLSLYFNTVPGTSIPLEDMTWSFIPLKGGLAFGLQIGVVFTLVTFLLFKNGKIERSQIPRMLAYQVAAAVVVGFVVVTLQSLGLISVFPLDVRWAFALSGLAVIAVYHYIQKGVVWLGTFLGRLGHSAQRLDEKPEGFDTYQNFLGTMALTVFVTFYPNAVVGLILWFGFLYYLAGGEEMRKKYSRKYERRELTECVDWDDKTESCNREQVTTEWVRKDEH